jgi:DNA polymerase-3 subunit delta'
VSADDAATAARLADGSVRRALRLAVSGAVEIAREIDRLFEGDRAADRAVRLALADRIAGDRDEETFRIAADVLRDRVVETVRTGARAGEPLSALDALSRFAGTLESRRRTLEIYNLDRKQFLLDAFADLAALLRPARTGGSPRA